MRAGDKALRRQQQRRACAAIQRRLDGRIRHTVRHVPLCFMIGDEKGHAKPGNIDGSRVIPRSVPQTIRVGTAEPRSPGACFLAIRRSRGRKSFGRLMTVWAGMGCPTRFNLARTYAQQMALVLERAPSLAVHCGSVAPVPKAPAHPSTTPFGFERSQIFSTDEPTV